MAIQSNILRSSRNGGQALRQSCIAKVSGEDAPSLQLQPITTIAISNTNTSDQQYSTRYLSWGIGICSASIFGVLQSSNNYNELHNIQRRDTVHHQLLQHVNLHLRKIMKQINVPHLIRNQIPSLIWHNSGLMIIPPPHRHHLRKMIKL